MNFKKMPRKKKGVNILKYKKKKRKSTANSKINYKLFK